MDPLASISFLRFIDQDRDNDVADATLWNDEAFILSLLRRCRDESFATSEN
jgi:hypothetical protein